jgi:hypothetical protein
MGRGLVHPLDMDHDDNPPSHPELLDLLADEFAAHKYDVKWFLRELALSKTYQRSSEVPKHLKGVDAEKYWVAGLKPLSPEQFATALLQATGKTDVDRKALGKDLSEAKLHARVAPQAAAFVNVFAGQKGEPETDFEATLEQTLFVKHAPAVRALLAPTPGNLVDRLNALTDVNALADELFLSVLTRLPTDEERKDIAAALKPAANRPTALGELVWTLIASAEFRFNH